MAASSKDFDDILFAETHEYVIVDGSRVLVGLSEEGLERLGEITFVELPEVGEVLSRGDSFATLEAEDASFDVTLPVSGEIITVNHQLEDEPELMNASPYSEGWLVEIELSDADELESLLSQADYKRFLQKN